MTFKVQPKPNLPLAAWKQAYLKSSPGKKKKTDADPIVTPETHQMTSMLVPMRTDGKDVFEITTRKDFLAKNIPTWVDWYKFRAMTVLFGVFAFILYPIHPILGVASGTAAGWAYGWYWRRDQALATLKKRDLLEAM